MGNSAKLIGSFQEGNQDPPAVGQSILNILWDFSREYGIASNDNKPTRLSKKQYRYTDLTLGCGHGEYNENLSVPVLWEANKISSTAEINIFMRPDALHASAWIR
jgi:hypothetical protein